MTKNYAEEIKELAELLDVKLEEEFEIDGTCFKFTDKGLYQFNSNLMLWTRAADHVLGRITYRLLQKDLKVNKHILTQKEKEYLSAVIKPFNDKILYISKHGCLDTEWLKVYMEKDDSMVFPKFKENTMYTNMEIDKEYTLEELGL